MLRQSGACVTCERLQFWRTPRIVVSPRCEQCGRRLVAPGTGAYTVLAFAVEAGRHAWTIQYIGRQRMAFSPHAPLADPRHPINETAQANAARIARNLAHTARRLYPHLRFEFDTDTAGRVVGF